MTTNPLDYNGRSRVFKIFSAIVLVLFAAVWVVPLLFAGVTSLRPESEIAADPTSWWSENFSLEAYRKVLDSTPMLTWYLNSFIIAALTVVLTVFVTSLIGFALAQTRFSGRGGVFALVLAGLLIPGQILVLPLYQIVQGMGC